MAIFLFKNTPCIVQGMTGSEGTFWSKHMLELGTNIVAGVTPGKGGMEVQSIPIYDSIEEAVEEHGAEVSVVFVPGRFAKDAALEALAADLSLLVLIPDGIPLYDAIMIRSIAKKKGTIVIGPNTPGMASIGKPSVGNSSMLGVVPVWLSECYSPGTIGVISRSGSLINEICSHIVSGGFGESTVIGVGGDMVIGSDMTEILSRFQDDPQTEAVVIIGEVGGTQEERAAQYIKSGKFTKPVISFIAGRAAPPGKRMGHAGAIIQRGMGSPESKRQALSGAGAKVVDYPKEISEVLKEILKR